MAQWESKTRKATPKSISVSPSFIPKGHPSTPFTVGLQVMEEANFDNHHMEISTGKALTGQQKARIRLAVYS